MAVIQDPNRDRTAELIRDAATNDASKLLERLGTSVDGLSDPEAAERVEVFGANEVAQERRHGWLDRIWVASRNPLVVLLTLLATVSFATGDLRAGVVMLLMVVLGVSLRFIQETEADSAAAKLKAMISVNRADMGQYQAAVDSPIRPADIKATRHYPYKFGFGLNVEQELTKSLGPFMRLGWSDGHTEASVFNDIDRAVTLGLSLKGDCWRRPNDTFGLAGIFEGLSHVHQEFLMQAASASSLATARFPMVGKKS